MLIFTLKFACRRVSEQKGATFRKKADFILSVGVKEQHSIKL